MKNRNLMNQLFDDEAAREAETSRARNCFNVAGSNGKSRQIRILQIGTAGVASIGKKPFLTTQPIKKQVTGLFNNEIFGQPHSAPKDMLMHVEAIKTGFFVQSCGQKHSRTISPEKYAFMAATEYIGMSSSPKRTRGWIARKKKVQELPKQFYRKSSQNGAILHLNLNEAQTQIDEVVSKSVNLLNKIKIAQQYNFNVSENKSGAVIQHKPRTKVEALRKTPQELAQQERRNKLQIKRQISQDYAKPFNPPTNITAASYIIFQPKFSENKGRKKKYFIDLDPESEANERARKKYPHSHKVVASFNSRNAVEIASLTKIMTCVIALEICYKFKLDAKEQRILIGKFQSNIGGTSAQICEGETYTLEDLLYGLMLPSGNDASVAIAVWGGRILLTHQIAQDHLGPPKKKQSYQRFILQMNNKAKQLGMHKTNYANSHGLCNTENKSCAFDLALLCEHAMDICKFRDIVACKVYRSAIEYFVGAGLPAMGKKGSVRELAADRDRDDEIEEGEEKDMDSNQEQNEEAMTETTIGQRAIEWQNTHRLVQQKSDEYIGIKTGITTAAGPCLASCIKAQNGRTFIIIVLNCDKLSMRFKDTQNLKKWIYQREGMSSPRKKLQRQPNSSPRQECFSPPLFPDC